MALVRPLAARAVHLKVYPRPTSLSESRELLSVLQQFGEVSMFKSLRFDYSQPAPNTCLAIYRDATSASKLLKASPLRFTLEPIPGDHTGDHYDQTAARSARDGGKPSDLGSSVDPGLADAIDDAEFDISDGPSKRGVEEMIRPSMLLYQTIESFSLPNEPAQSAPEPFSNDVSDAAQSNASSASYDANLVAQSERDYAASEQRSDPDPAPDKHVPEPRPSRVFHVVADVSEMNHRDYIERSFWYGPYHPRKRTASYIDLTARDVFPGIADVHTNKPEQPLRIVQDLRTNVSARSTLRQIWENGEAQRTKSLGSSSAASVQEPR